MNFKYFLRNGEIIKLIKLVFTDYPELSLKKEHKTYASFSQKTNTYNSNLSFTS